MSNYTPNEEKIDDKLTGVSTAATDKIKTLEQQCDQLHAFNNEKQLSHSVENGIGLSPRQIFGRSEGYINCLCSI